jgi:hypothetical protein
MLLEAAQKLSNFNIKASDRSIFLTERQEVINQWREAKGVNSLFRLFWVLQ